MYYNNLDNLYRSQAIIKLEKMREAATQMINRLKDLQMMKSQSVWAFLVCFFYKDGLKGLHDSS